jgi:hypothetical protein
LGIEERCPGVKSVIDHIATASRSEVNQCATLDRFRRTRIAPDIDTKTMRGPSCRSFSESPAYTGERPRSDQKTTSSRQAVVRFASSVFGQSPEIQLPNHSDLIKASRWRQSSGPATPTAPTTRKNCCCREIVGHRSSARRCVPRRRCLRQARDLRGTGAAL